MGNILEVSMGEHAPGFFTAIGKKTTPVPFDIVLTSGPGASCTATKTASIAFDNDAAHVDKASGNLKISSTSPAKGIQIEINDAGNTATGKIRLGVAQTNPQKVVLSDSGRHSLVYGQLCLDGCHRQRWHGSFDYSVHGCVRIIGR